MQKRSQGESLSEILINFNKISTWAKEKKKYKNQIIKKIKKEKLYVFIGSKSSFKLTKFGETRMVSSQTLSHLKNFKTKELELICMDKEHCDYMYIAVKEIGR
jgi:hypothetical protein